MTEYPTTWTGVTSNGLSTNIPMTIQPLAAKLKEVTASFSGVIAYVQ